MLGNLVIAAKSPLSQYSTLFILVIFLILMYFLMLRPQQKQQKKHQSMLGQMKKGDHVVTIGRLHGVVDEIDKTNQTVTLDCDGIYLVFDLRAISSVTEQAPATVAAPAADDDQASKDDDQSVTAPAEKTKADDQPADSDEDATK